MGRTKKQIKESNPKIGIGYIRASKEEQQLTPDGQKKAIESWAQLNGVEIISYHEDLGISGAAAIDDRPGLLGAIEALEISKAGYLVVAKRDRLARDVVAAATIERLCERLGSKIVSADSIGNGDGPESMLLKGMVDVFAQYERSLIKSRTKTALGIKKSRGEWLGKPPYGFKLSTDGISLIPIEAEQGAIKTMQTLRISGCTLQEIGTTLEHSGIYSRTGKSWAPMTIKRIVERTV